MDFVFFLQPPLAEEAAQIRTGGAGQSLSGELRRVQGPHTQVRCRRFPFARSSTRFGFIFYCLFFVFSRTSSLTTSSRRDWLFLRVLPVFISLRSDARLALAAVAGSARLSRHDADAPAEDLGFGSAADWRPKSRTRIRVLFACASAFVRVRPKKKQRHAFRVAEHEDGTGVAGKEAASRSHLFHIHSGSSQWPSSFPLVTWKPVSILSRTVQSRGFQWEPTCLFFPHSRNNRHRFETSELV